MANTVISVDIGELPPMRAQEVIDVVLNNFSLAALPYNNEFAGKFFEFKENPNDTLFKYEDTVLRPFDIIKLHNALIGLVNSGAKIFLVQSPVFQVKSPANGHELFFTCKSRAADSIDQMIEGVTVAAGKSDVYLYQVLRFRAVNPDTFEPHFGYKIRYATGDDV